MGIQKYYSGIILTACLRDVIFLGGSEQEKNGNEYGDVVPNVAAHTYSMQSLGDTT